MESRIRCRDVNRVIQKSYKTENNMKSVNFQMDRNTTVHRVERKQTSYMIIIRKVNNPITIYIYVYILYRYISYGYDGSISRRGEGMQRSVRSCKHIGINA